ncbi:MAG: hypothetical protein RL033_5279 [Pseudomonadota bacterium]|jgi:hypothetical protein
MLDGVLFDGVVLRWRHCWLLAALGLACTESVQLGENYVRLPTAPDASGVAGASGLGGVGGIDGYPIEPLPDAGPGAAPVPSSVCAPVSCAGRERACGNCLDDDRDGVVDANDPECLGPCDDSEAELFTGVSVRTNASCRADCFFDLNAGSGDDGCSWSLQCDPLAPAGDVCSFDPNEPRCQMDGRRASACQASCLPLTPNGCDCFGCCELPAASGNFIWLGSESAQSAHCELASSADPSQCRPCTPVPECQNDCAPCELCVGKTSLPASCGAGGALTPQCSEGVTPCDPSQPGACGSLHYCITGCCVLLPR